MRRPFLLVNVGATCLELVRLTQQGDHGKSENPLAADALAMQVHVARAQVDQLWFGTGTEGSSLPRPGFSSGLANR